MSGSNHKFHFLLIDDDPIFNFLNERIVEESQCASSIVVHIAAEEALAYLRELIDTHQALPGIILLDLRMPSMTGLEFLVQFHALPESATAETRICMLSSSLNEKDRSASLNFPRVTDFMSKPLTAELLQDFCSRI